MHTASKTVKQYLEQLSEEDFLLVNKIRQTILKNLPKGFGETISYGMIAYVVPHSVYPDGYHCTPAEPLPFMSIALQKNSLTLHHMGIYADKKLLKWLMDEYPKHSSTKLDMGKGCIRFKNTNTIPYKLIGALAGKMSSSEWIKLYELNIKR